MNSNNEFDHTCLLLTTYLFEFIPYLGVVNFASQICHENINKPLDGAYLAGFDIDITANLTQTSCLNEVPERPHTGKNTVHNR